MFTVRHLIYSRRPPRRSQLTGMGCQEARPPQPATQSATIGFARVLAPRLGGRSSALSLRRQGAVSHCQIMCTFCHRSGNLNIA